MAARAGAGCLEREGPAGLGCSRPGGITGRGRWPPRWKGTRAAPVRAGGLKRGSAGCSRWGVRREGDVGHGVVPPAPLGQGGAEGEVSAAPCQ